MSLQGSLKDDKCAIRNILKKHYRQDWRNYPSELEFYKIIDGRNTVLLGIGRDESESQDENEGMKFWFCDSTNQ
nr:unnamed protein product [Callosobruchus chinensis]